MVLGSLRREDISEDDESGIFKVPSVIPEDPNESRVSTSELGQKENISANPRDNSLETEIIPSMRSTSLCHNPTKPDFADSEILMARKGSSRGFSIGSSRNAPTHLIEPLLQTALDLVGNMSPKRSLVIKDDDINAPFIALNPPILPVMDDTRSSVFLAPGVSKGPEQQRHAQGIDSENEAEPDDHW